MMRLASRTGGELILPKFRSPREVHPPLVVLADISGSMSQYTRIFLHFLHALTEKRRRVHTFVFGTRLTNLTRQMRHRDPDDGARRMLGCGQGLVGRHAHRRYARRVQPAVVAPGAGAGRGRAADHRRAGARRHSRPVEGDGAAAKILPAADLAQSAAALRWVRGAGAGCQGHAAPCRRVPRRAQSRTRWPISAPRSIGRFRATSIRACGLSSGCMMPKVADFSDKIMPILRRRNLSWKTRSSR